ncbi:LysR substrate-binding domain-containing protein [Microbulbifer sp. SA54]|uniref:LysR substrate-binding domain-containing protein n=1 Tax=Microbulbifer sp. SA54 TaxID=3401577 RepID=UPI003AACF3B2
MARHNCLLGTLDYWRFHEQGRPRNIRVSGSIRCNSGRALVDAALKGIGIVQLPDYYVDEDLEAGRLVSLLEHYREQDDGIWGIYPQNRHLSAKVSMLLDFLSGFINSV